MKVETNREDEINIIKDDLFSNLYDWVTVFVTIVPWVLFIGRLFVRNIMHIEFYEANIAIGVLLTITIISIYFMLKDERYRLYIGDTKCQVGGMLIGLLLGYFMPNTKNFNDMVVNFTLIITALFFISDGISDMNSIWETLENNKGIFNNSPIKRDKRIQIIKILNNARFIITLVVMTSTLIIGINIIQFYVNKINIDQLIANNLLNKLIVLIGVLGFVIPTIPISSELLKLVFIFSKKELPNSKKDISVIIINTFKRPYKFKMNTLLFVTYYLLIVLVVTVMLLHWHWSLNLVTIPILIVLPILVKYELLKIISNKLEKV